MDLRSLEIFVAVAEELHFRRAAARLNTTQPAVSMRIRALENLVGVALFARDRRSVALTEAGRSFLDHARSAVRHGRDGMLQARKAARGEIGLLRLGYTPLTSYAGMPTLVRRFREAHPGVRVELVQDVSAGLEAAVAADAVDVALLHPPLYQAGISFEELYKEELILALPAEHRLARVPDIRMHDLGGEPFLIGPRSLGPHLYDEIILRFRQAAIQPNIVQEIAGMANLIGLAAAGVGLGFVIRSLDVIQRPGVIYRPIVDVQPLHLPIAVAWRENSQSAILTHVRAVAGECYPLREHSPDATT